MTDIYDGPRLVADNPKGDDTVAQLLRLAGHRPAVPVADAAIVREAARAQWRRTVKAERRRTYFYRGGGGLLAVAALIFLVLNSGHLRGFLGIGDQRAPQAIATLEGAIGEVTASLSGSPLARLVPGTPLPAGTWVETGPTRSGSGPPARVALRLANGVMIRLDADTRLRLLAGAEVELERGAVFVDSDSLESTIAVHTPLGVARDVGTRFAVRLGPRSRTLQIKVRDGEVSLERDGQSHLIDAGRELAVLVDGSLQERPIPPFENRNSTEYDLLAWVAEEGGWELRFADPTIEAQAVGNTLGGFTSLGPKLEDALELLRMGSGHGLSYRLQGVVLHVEPAD